MAPDEPTLPMDGYRTPAASGEAEIRVQRSRFLAQIAPAADEESARTVVREMERRHHDSRHVCFAWRLGPPPSAAEHRNDAGEPSGTAGEPILDALRKADLSDCVGVVVRWFGGVKLGTGGLARAYRAAMETAAGNVAVREVLLGQEFEVGLPYALQKTVRHLVDGRQGKVVREEYGEGVSWIVWLPSSRCPGFAAEVIDATAGQVTVARVDS